MQKLLIFSYLLITIFFPVAAMEQRQTLVKELKKMASGTHRVTEDDYAKISAMIKEGTQVNVADEDGVTPLMVASSRIHLLGYMEELLEAEANVNAQDVNGQTALISLDGLHARIVLFNQSNMGKFLPNIFKIIKKQKRILHNAGAEITKK